MNYIEQFRNKYEYINHETLALAAQEDPQLLKDLIENSELNQLALGIALSSLGEAMIPDYLDFIKSYTTHSSSLVQEGAYRGLGRYLDDPIKYGFILVYLKEEANKPLPEPVLKTINSQIK